MICDKCKKTIQQIPAYFVLVPQEKGVKILGAENGCIGNEIYNRGNENLCYFPVDQIDKWLSELKQLKQHYATCENCNKQAFGLIIVPHRGIQPVCKAHYSEYHAKHGARNTVFYSLQPEHRRYLDGLIEELESIVEEA